ncbi:MAG: SH3 domain-containing protein [Anaerolineales bacterium]|nr:SH3 domain-containing protein [Anaerolineales bacterium]
MIPKQQFFILISLGFLFSIAFMAVSAVQAEGLFQQPTVSVPTVTGTPAGIVIQANYDNEQINVRSGPSTKYELVGILIQGQQVSALGKSTAGDWIQIVYPGVEDGVAWVYSGLVSFVVPGELPIVEPPPLPTPETTPTIDPTLASQLILEVPETREPTFTAPAPLVIPTFESTAPLLSPGNFPMGFVISILGVIGVLGVVVILLRR